MLSGPECLRHRYRDRALCIWNDEGPEAGRWVARDGIASLIVHIALHLSREASCRNGDPWPGGEAAPHDRPAKCRTCGGRGA